jgi:hypothetical protein
MKRPTTVIILVILTLISALTAIYHALQFAGVLPFRLFGGGYKLFLPQFNTFGVVMSAIFALIWLYVAWMLWKLDSGGWNITIVVAFISLAAYLLIMLAGTSWQEVAASMIVDILIVILCLLPVTRSVYVKKGWGRG